VQSGLQPGQCPEMFALDQPQTLEEIARSYLEVGAELLGANTFGASPLKLAQYGLEPRMMEINRAAVGAVRRAVGDRAYVAASCGPSGRMLKPYGDIEPEAVYESFVGQIECLADAGVDCICIETMTDLGEAMLAVKAVRAVAPALPVTATMTFDATPRGFFTIMGVSVEQAAAGLMEAGADVVGSNCGTGTAQMVEIAQVFGDCTSLPVLIQPNAGLPELKDGVPVYGETPEFMAGKVGELLAAGVSLLGGCCGTTPEHIRALRKVLDAGR
ncbi:MAG: hypothetical protein GY842_07035, partial [bacterium]|nr:hypothetical protein [bacterium]